MTSRNKKTTMAKIMRETRLRERRLDKKARKDARRQAPPTEEGHEAQTSELTEHDTPQPAGAAPAAKAPATN